MARIVAYSPRFNSIAGLLPASAYAACPISVGPLGKLLGALLFATALLVPILSRAAFATSITFLWTPEGLVVAADSKVANNDCRTMDTVCKIERIGNRFVAYAGPTIIHGPNGDEWFDGRQIVRNAFRPWRSLDETRTVLEETMKVRLARLGQNYQRIGMLPQNDAQDWLNANVSISAVVFGVEDSTVRLLQTQVSAVIRRDGSIAASVLPEGSVECPPCGLSRMGYVGRTRGIVQEHIALPGDLGDIWPWAVPAELVHLELNSQDKCWVGAPVDILVVQKDGPCWLQRQCSCEQGIPACAESILDRAKAQDGITNLTSPAPCPTTASLEPTPSSQLNPIWWAEQARQEQGHRKQD